MPVSADPRIGTEIIGYRIEALVGRGGMGVVYRAYDLRLKRNVALKLIAPELSRDERFRERFLTETELAASLEHPNVVPVHDAGEVGDQLYIAMRYVEGGELKTLLQTDGPLEPGRALAICRQVAAALDAAHERGLVHRDVKPSNVLLDETEHVYLADFGLSRRLADRGVPGEAGLSVGTPAYVAPEQIEGRDIGGGADQYALGCLLYECLTGQPPFARASELAMLWAHMQEPPPKASEHNPALPIEVDPVIATAMAKDPEQRYITCLELVQAAREALGVEQAPPRGMSRRAKAIGAAVLVAAAGLVAGLILAFGGGANARAKPNLAVKTNTLVRISSKTNKIADVIPVGRDPESLAYGGNTVWVYNNADHTVEGIDTTTDAVVVPPTAISGDVPTGGGTYRAVAADREGAWVLSVQEPNDRGLLTHVRRDVPSTDQLHLPGTPVAIAVGDAAIWVTTTNGRTGALLRIDPRTQAVRTLVLPGLDATPNWVAVGAGAVWLTDAPRASPTGTQAIGGVPHSRLFRIDPETMRITGRRPISCLVQGMCALAIGPGSVWIVADPGAGPFRLLHVDPGRMQVTGVLHTPDLGTVFLSGTGSVGLDGNTIWYAGDGAVRVDIRTSRIVARIHLLDHPNLFAFPSAIVTGGGSVWIAIAAPT